MSIVEFPKDQVAHVRDKMYEKRGLRWSRGLGWISSWDWKTLNPGKSHTRKWKRYRKYSKKCNKKSVRDAFKDKKCRKTCAEQKRGNKLKTKFKWCGLCKWG